MQGFYLPSLRLLGVLFLAACSLTAQAATDETDHSATFEKNQQSYVINADGSFVQTIELVTRINEERAIKSNAQRSLSYNRSLETLEVLEAFTRKPDGRQVKVSAEQIKEQQETASSQAPMFQDSRVKVVIFPQVTVGDRLVLRYQRQRTTPLFPQQFEDFFVPDFYDAEQLSLSYDLPADKPLFVDARGFKASTPAAAAGRKVYRWDYVPQAKARIENGAVSYVDYGQFLAVSTFASYKDFAQAYEARAQVEVTPAIAALAKQLTANLTTPRSKALALSDWVRKNIRYVAVYVGAGGVVPHPAQAVLDNRYGDCKDHVALLEAMLRAVAIESSPVLVNQGNSYTLAKVPTLGVLNHAITYVPALDLYLDSTAAAIAAGYLPIPVLGKPVLLTQSGELAKTPAGQTGKVSNDLLFKVDSNGAADFVHATTVEGWGSEFNRYLLNAMKPADRDSMIRNVLGWYGQTGQGTFKSDSLQDEVNPFKNTLEGRTDNLVNLPGPTGVPALSSLVGGIAQNVFAFASEKDRTQGFGCLAGETQEQARFEFPKEVTVLAVPKPQSLQQAGFDYQATYAKEGNTVLITRYFKFAHANTVCSPEDFKAMKPVIESMVNDLKGQIIVQTL